MKRSSYIQLIFLITIFTIGFFWSKKSKRLLGECSIETTAYVIDKYKISKRGWFMKYKYKVNDNEYKSSESIKGKKAITAINVGNTIKIRYSCEDTSISKYIEIE
ncbi:MAG: hypothetical protein ACJATF_003529 [Flavobacteriales bacterium]